MRTLVVTALAVLLAAACGQPPSPAAPPPPPRPSGPDLGSEFRLDQGRTVTLSGVDLTVGYDALVADSRCPEGQTCVWEGDAEITVSLDPGAGPRRVALHTSSQFPTSAVESGYRVTLVGLDRKAVTARLKVERV